MQTISFWFQQVWVLHGCRTPCSIFTAPSCLKAPDDFQVSCKSSWLLNQLGVEVPHRQPRGLSSMAGRGLALLLVAAAGGVILN